MYPCTGSRRGGCRVKNEHQAVLIPATYRQVCPVSFSIADGEVDDGINTSDPVIADMVSIPAHVSYSLTVTSLPPIRNVTRQADCGFGHRVYPRPGPGVPHCKLLVACIVITSCILLHYTSTRPRSTNYSISHDMVVNPDTRPLPEGWTQQYVTFL